MIKMVIMKYESIAIAIAIVIVIAMVTIMKKEMKSSWAGMMTEKILMKADIWMKMMVMIRAEVGHSIDNVILCQQACLP